MSTTSSSSSIFTGSSAFSTDFQNALTRAVQIASLPIVQLANQKAELGNKQAAYQSLEGKLSSVRDAVASLKNAVGANSYTAATSDNTVATATASAGAMEGSYSLEVVDPGAYSTWMTSSDLSAELSGGTFTLTMDGTPLTITPSSATLTSLASAINAAQTDVRASVVNLGSQSRLSLQSTGVKHIDLSLDAGAGNLAGAPLSDGHEATYRVNGEPSTPISTDSRTITLAPGLTASILKQGTSDIEVTRNSAAVSNALSSLANAYNAAVSELATDRASGGVLAGDSQVRQIASDLRSLINFRGAGSGTVQNLASIGLEFDKNGQLSLNTETLASASVQDITSFFGDGTSAGFLQNANSLLDGMDGTDANSLIPATLSSLANQITRTDNSINSNQDRVDLLQQSLAQKMAQADAAIAQMEQQSQYYDNLFQAMKNDSSKS